jgi:LPS-assembly lipoprotein
MSKRLCFWLICLINLSACGFHLRGMQRLPASFQTVYISAAGNQQQLLRNLTQEFKTYQVTVFPSQKNASMQIYIDDVQFNRQISNISSSTTPKQFQLYYIVKYHVIDSNGENCIPNGRILVNRMVTMNSERLLGSNYEQDFFQEEMQAEAARQMVAMITHYHKLS